MRIESLTIDNYRQYRHAEYNFGKKDGKNDIHIVLGSNGVGKTNMMNAITWCLYDKEMHLGDKNTAAPMINSSYIQELREQNETLGSVTVVIIIASQDDNDSKIRVQRTSSFRINPNNVKNLEERLEVMNMRNNEWQSVVDEETAKSMIHKYVPEEINEYIFFDGEQLEKYFQEQQRENIKNGIKELTQSSLLEKAAFAFENYINSTLTPKIRTCGNTRVQKCQQNVDDARDKVIVQKEIVNEVNGQIETCNHKIDELEGIIRGHENIAEKNKRFHELEGISDQLEDKKKNILSEMMKFVREYYQYLGIYPALKSLYDYIKKQEESGNLPPKIDKDLIAHILKDKCCSVCGSALDEGHLAHILEIQKKLELSTATSAELNRAMSALVGYFDIISKYEDKKQGFKNDINDINLQINGVCDEYKKLSEYLASVPNNETLTKAVADRNEYKSKLKSSTEKLGAESLILKSLKSELESAEIALKRALEENQKLETLNNQIEYCKKCKVLLTNTKDEILSECRNAMQNLTYNIFSKLLWKKGAFTKVEIEDDYTFRLLDMYGEQTLGSCSAAERALLALSFTLALQDISKHESMLYIDTPIGRVDPDNRINFINVLLGISESKQVILTFTPTEYDYNVRELLDGRYSTFSELKIKDGVTSIERI